MSEVVVQDIIGQKMEKIKTIFQKAQEQASKAEDINELIAFLQTTEKEFLPVAYEGAAMTLALNDFSEGDSISNWKQLLDSSKKYSCQIYLGMGWAVGQQKKSELPFLELLSRNMQFRMWDGCGYYDGIFRQRQSIKSKKRSENILPKDFQAYDEGLGRSLWYICKGDVAKVGEMLATFDLERHVDLWRGVSIACCFVGGFDENKLKELIVSSGEYKVQLGIGAAMVAKIRIEADCITDNVELANKVFNQLSAEEAMKITVKNKSVPNFSFSTFILQMESDLMKVVDSRQKEKVDN